MREDQKVAVKSFLYKSLVFYVAFIFISQSFIFAWGQLPPIIKPEDTILNIVPGIGSDYYLESLSKDQIFIDHFEGSPKVKVEKWAGESYMVLYANVDTFTNPVLASNVLTWSNPSLDIKIYPLSETDQFEAGGLEIELILKSNPGTNIFNFEISTRNMVFAYQPALTQEEIDHGDIRPPNIIGSYAVYHPSKKGNEYKTGKIMHIYRPLIVDSKGIETWGDLSIDLDKQLLTITVDQKFLDTASYPVSVDPSIGYTTIGGSKYNPDPERLRAQREYLPEESFITNIAAYFGSAATSGSLKYAVYDNGYYDLPYNLEGYSANVSAPLGWVNASCYTGTLEAQYIYLAFWTSDTWLSGQINYDDFGENRSVYGSIRSWNGFVDPWEGTKSNFTRVHSIYANYTLASSSFYLTAIFGADVDQYLVNGTSKTNSSETEFTENQIANITLIMASGYVFKNLKFLNGTVAASSLPYYLTMDQNYTIIAYSDRETSLSLSVDPVVVWIGQVINLRASLSWSGSALNDQAVLLQESPDNSTWTNILTHDTNSLGLLDVSHAQGVPGTWYYRASYTGVDPYADALSSSSAVEVNVRGGQTQTSTSDPVENNTVDYDVSLKPEVVFFIFLVVMSILIILVIALLKSISTYI